MDAIVLSGTVGVGKTTVAAALRTLLTSRGYAVGDLDADALAHASLAAPDDPFNERAIVAHLQDRRSRWHRLDVLLIPRVVETAAQRDAYADALDAPVRVARIDAPSTTRHARLLARHEPGHDRDWHLARTDELAALLVTAAVEDLVVTNDDRAPSAVAAQIADALGL